MHCIDAIIADDEKDSREVLGKLLRDTGNVNIIRLIAKASEIESTVNMLKPDILFLDIEMPGLDGISVLSNLRKYNKTLMIVIVSAYEKYIPKAIKFNVLDYLLKPVARRELDAIINTVSQVKSESELSASEKLIIPVKDGYTYLDYMQLLLLEADGNYTRVRTIKNEVFTSSYNLGRIYRRLPRNIFLRINRAIVLNSSYIKMIDKKNLSCTIEYDEGSELLSVSKSFIIQFNKTSRDRIGW